MLVLNCFVLWCQAAPLPVLPVLVLHLWAQGRAAAQVREQEEVWEPT